MKRTSMKTNINKPVAITYLENTMYYRATFILPLLLSLGVILAGCTPSVKVEAPEKPITINLNVKIEHEIRVKVDKELDDVFSKDSGLF